ncbi:CbiQ family ECF transporter T component [Rudaeicoccus suwonensis]|uniref:Energy-coupling factor transport system permease protein n=1 Tax=Rudaeicoccus suwonensis TaxID=657409 RepID=A0A561E6K0_9MICO|nr:CbiQ family ECF transporter T component [Rudaeicoccus suwonensis]TWE11246.1 energy-coupling factor transport system permease protein [Rudaeicoccus suwonensis]
MPVLAEIGRWLRFSRLPRNIHPVAWWVWAISVAVAATWTTNPLLLLLLMAASTCVVLRRRGDAPWSRSFRLYVMLGATIVVLRVFFRIVFGGGEGTTVLLRLPDIPLPQWAAGIRLFGTVSAQSVLGGLYNGLQLAAMVLCVGAANALANPKRLLKAVPNGLYDVGTAVIVAVSVFPQLAESVQRVRRARRLRGGLGKRHAVRAVVIPVLADALDRSLLLAAAMDSRGYGRHGRDGARAGAITGALTIVGMIGVCIGAYNMLGPDPNFWLKWPALIGGLVLGCSGLFVASTRVRTTRYRPDPIDLTAVLVGACGLGTVVLMYAAKQWQPAHLVPTLQPLEWPVIDTLPLLAALVAMLPAWIAPHAPMSTSSSPETVVPQEIGVAA